MSLLALAPFLDSAPKAIQRHLSVSQHRHPAPRYDRNITVCFPEDDNLFIRELICGFPHDCEHDFV